MSTKPAYRPARSVIYRPGRSVKGFTFMELLVAMTIFAIIASSVYYTLGAGVRVYRRGNTMMRDNQALRIFFDTVSQHLRNAVIYSDEKKNFYIEPEWEEDRVSFPALINTFDEGVVYPELARITYYLEGKKREGKKFMVKYATEEHAFDEENAEGEAMLEDLEDFTLEDIAFKYCYKVTGFDDEYDWREDDEFEDGLPRGIKIELTLKNKARKSKEILEKTIFIAMGELGDDTK